ncbi:MAG TPA: Hsp20/alpha crystallin family protein [Bacteroidia bacterium]|jgi:HSP20 family protein|nr:Hsp20/alpha crystallin family protein [Bacteroidia bacterium]
MTLVLKRNGNHLPSLVSDFFNNDNLLNPEFSDLGLNLVNLRLSAKIPSVNIIENHKDFKIELAAPGLEKKDFKVEVEGKVLTVSSEKKEEKEEKDKNYTRREFSYSSFSRSFMLPENLLTDKIDAKYEGGILKLSLPKKDVAQASIKKEISVA